MPLFADIWDHFTNNGIAVVVLGAIGLLTVYVLAVQAIKVTRETFGRQPPMASILREINRKLEEVQKKIAQDMKLLVPVAELTEYKEEVRLRCVGLEKQISDARHSFDERANSDLKRTLETFDQIVQRGERRDEIVTGLSRVVSRLQERTESHLRKFDQYDTKMDNLLTKVAEAAARGVRSARND
jgi:hypothetical protein